MKNAYFLATIVGFAFISCKDELKPQESYIDYSAKTNTTTNQNTATTPGLNPNQQVVATPAKANPPHGQPGHVCGTEGQQQNISTQVQPNNTQQLTINQAVSSSAVKTAKGMNPPHGQPGHRCDIAVGAPLNSKPVQVPVNKSSQVITQTNTTQNAGFSVTPVDPTKQNSTPALLNPNNGQTNAPAGTNPPHGQPGHVCGTPVTTTTTTADTKEVKKE